MYVELLTRIARTEPGRLLITPLRAADSFNNDMASIDQQIQLECGPMTDTMVALPNIGGALCSTPQSFADAHY